MKKYIFIFSIILLSNTTMAVNMPYNTPEKYDYGTIDQIFRDIYKHMGKISDGVVSIDNKMSSTQKPRYSSYEIMAIPSGQQTQTTVESAINTQSAIIYNIQMSTFANPGFFPLSAANTTYVHVLGDTMLGTLNTTYYINISTSIVGLKRIEWADGSITTFAVTAGATSADLTAFKGLMADDTNFIAISTGTERTERIAKDTLLDSATGQLFTSSGTVLPLDGSKSMTGDFNMGTHNIQNTSTMTTIVMNVTQINWADGQTSSTSHIGDLTADQADARYLLKTSDTIQGKLTGTTTVQVPTVITNEIIYPNGSRQTSYGKANPYITIAAVTAPQRIKDIADFVCDGAADQAEFNAAISSAATTGAIIDGMGYSFMINATININQSSITIQNANILENSAGNFDSITIASNVCNIALKNLFIKNNSVGTYGINGNAVNIIDINIDNCRIIGANNLDGFYFPFGSKIVINNCIADSCSTGFYIFNTTFTIISNCKTFSSITYGYRFGLNKTLLSINNLSDNTVKNDFDYTTNVSSNVFGESWRTPTFVNSWVDYGGVYSTTAYMKDGLGFVHLRGTVKSGSTGTVFTLPVGYRPEFRQSYSVACYDGANYIVGECEILTDGTVGFSKYNNTFTSLDNIIFKAEN